MDWYRAYHGLCTDPKLHRIARSIGVRRGIVVAGWVAVMETASSNTKRGCVGEFDHVTMAFMIDVPPHVGAKIWGAFKSAGMVDEDGKVTAWDRRQRSSDDASVRKRIQRQRVQLDNPLETKKTNGECHGTNPQVEQNRTDKIREETPPLRSPPHPNGAGEAPPTAPPKPQRDPPTGSRLPADWQPSPTDIEFALKEGLTHDDIGRESADFRDYWLGAAGQRARKSDWPATWRRWVRKAADDRNRPARSAGGNGGGGGGNRRADSRPTGLLANTLAVLHRRGSLAGPLDGQPRMGRVPDWLFDQPGGSA